jgi:hypothetical protein
MAICEYIIPLITLVPIIVILLNESLFHEVFASPSFGRQVIRDIPLDWFEVNNQSGTTKGDPATDIVEVSYFSSGKTLNATLWLLFPFKDEPSEYDTVNYGMFIDADFSNKTGVNGIDYQIEIKWRNETKTWDKVVTEWSSTNKARVLDNKTNYTDFYQKGENYVLLSADLDAFLSPEKYKVLFYAEVKKNNSLRTDFTRWVAAPPVKLVVSTSPSSVELRKGEDITIEVKVNSTQGFEPIVNLYTTNQSKNINFNFAYDTLRIPSYGVATTPLTISSSKDALVGPYTLFIFANSTFPAEQFISKPISEEDIRSSIDTENVVTQSSLIITVQEPLSLTNQINDFWNKLGSPISFVYGVVAGISPWVFNKIKIKLNKDRNRKNNNETGNNR